MEGCDCDPVAVEIARENAELNGVSERCAFTEEALGTNTRRFPVVVANIMAHILIELRDDLIDRVESGGALFLSGILEGQVPSVLRAFESKSLELTRRQQAGEWVLLGFRRT